MSKLTKKWKKITDEVDFSKVYSVKEAINALKPHISKNFDESLDIAVRLGVDPRHADQMVKGTCKLPNGLGKTIRVAVFARGALAEQAKEAGADIIGAENLMQDILDGKIEFDRLIASPDMMSVVGRLGKVLGPRGLMPNPKTGTVTTNIKQTVEEIKAGSVEYKCDKTGIVHVGLGKMSFDTDKLFENVSAFIKSLMKAKPSGAKGNYVLGTSISSTQGFGVKVTIKEFLS